MAMMGPVDGAAAARAYAALSGGMDSDVSADAVRNDELLHDAGIDTGLSKPVKLAVAATVAVVLIVLAAVLLR